MTVPETPTNSGELQVGYHKRLSHRESCANDDKVFLSNGKTIAATVGRDKYREDTICFAPCEPVQRSIWTLRLAKSVFCIQ